MTSIHSIQSALYEQSFNLSSTGIACAGIDGQMKVVNPALCRMLGYEERELLAAGYFTLIHPEDLALVHLQIGRLKEQSESFCSIKIRLIPKSGHWFWTLQQLFLMTVDSDQRPLLHIHIDDLSGQLQPGQKLPVHPPFHEQIALHSPDIITFTDPDGFCMYASSSMRTLLGYEPEELIGGRLFDIFHPEDRAAFQFYTFADSDKLTCRVRHKNGHYVWFETMIKSIRNEQGALESVAGFGRDISDRVHTEQALIRSQKDLAEAQKIASIGSWDWDIRKDEVVWTEELFRIVELHPSQFVGKYASLMNFVHPEDREMFEQKLGLAFSGDLYELECRFVTAKNGIKHVHVQGFVIFDDQGLPLKMHGTVQDISERKQVQELLAETYDRYTSLKNYNPDAIISLDKNGFISSANPAAKEISGYTIEELTGMHFSSLLHRDDVCNVIEKFKLIMDGEHPERLDIRMLHKDGSVIDLLITPAPIIIQKRLVGCYIMVKDMTDQKKKDEMLRKSEKLSVVGQLAAGVAHEIRNPLTALKGFIQLMMHNEQQVPKYLDIMKEELDRIELIVSELLVLSKPQSLQLKLMNMKDLVEEVQALIGTQAIMNNIEIILTAEQDDYPVYCDPNQIKQIIINFLKNSIEAMKDGGVITIRLDVPSGFTILRIEDQGCGIPEELLSRLGEPFFTTKEGGTGLGLMISQKIIEHHGGQLFVTSTLNVGTTVEVRFPVPQEGMVEGEGTGV
ncbi:MAG: two-component sensor histidine kinase [Paenibacillus sp.]|jgi:two-component system sporulation sensor kinase A|nr:two-component sensor histidine kinase [Paenibacillus sp.]